jgi:hypothetical protein
MTTHKAVGMFGRETHASSLCVWPWQPTSRLSGPLLTSQHGSVGKWAKPDTNFESLAAKYSNDGVLRLQQAAAAAAATGSGRLCISPQPIISHAFAETTHNRALVAVAAANVR